MTVDLGRVHATRMATLAFLILILAAVTLMPLIGCLLAALIQVLLPKRSLAPRSRGLLGAALASGCILALWLAAIHSPRGSFGVAAAMLWQGWTAVIWTGRVVEISRPAPTSGLMDDGELMSSGPTWVCEGMPMGPMSEVTELRVSEQSIKLPKLRPDACGQLVFEVNRVFVCKDGTEPAIRVADCRDHGGVARRATEKFRLASRDPGTGLP